MTAQTHPKDDPRTVDALVNAALCEMDEDAYWNAIVALHWRGNREVLQRAEELCASECAQERCIGADILGQLGVPDRTFPEESTKMLMGMLKHGETAEVLRTALVGLSHQDVANTDAIPLISSFSAHPDPEVRHAVVLALSGCASQLAIEKLIVLSRDSDAHVRDWATFGLGTQIESDTSQIRDALADRLEDFDDDARGEALVGLARRKDHRVVEAIRRELRSDCIGTLTVEAAELIASTELHSELVALREWWDVNPELLERAISASQP